MCQLEMKTLLKRNKTKIKECLFYRYVCMRENINPDLCDLFEFCVFRVSLGIFRWSAPFWLICGPNAGSKVRVFDDVDALISVAGRLGWPFELT